MFITPWVYEEPGIATLVGEPLSTGGRPFYDGGQLRKVRIVLDLSDVEVGGLVAIDSDQVFAVVSYLCHNLLTKLN